MLMTATPQTPRMKASKLSLDIGGFSGVGSPVSPPSSPSFGACPSPTFSASMNMNKSQAELTALLKEAYNGIKEKERDLTLAAEIGKSLLENNISLKAKYEALAAQLQQLQRDRTRDATFSLQARAVNKPNVPPIAPPDSFIDDQFEFEESDNDSNYGRSSSVDYSIHDSSKKNKQRINYKDLENLRELESRNLQLESKLSDAINECTENEKSNKAKLKKMETELHHYQNSFSSATHKIEELEKENERLKQKQKSEFWNLKYNKTDNQGYVETLLRKVEDLDEQNHIVERAKSEIEKRLNRVTKELDALQEQYKKLIDASKDNEILRELHREQELLINDLGEALEEQKTMMASMRSGYSRNPSRSNSFSENNIMTNAIRRLSNPDGLSLFGSANSGLQSKSLLSELENVWFRDLSMFKKERKNFGDNDDSALFSPASSERDLSYFLPHGHTDDDISQIDYLSDGEFSFLDEFEDDEDVIRKREWFWRRWIRRWVEAIYSFLMMIWKWCRFLFLLIAADIMALYRGPDYFLYKEV